MASDTPNTTEEPADFNPIAPADLPEPAAAMPLEHFGTNEPLASDANIDHEDRTANDLSTVFEVPVSISAVLGRSSLSVAQLLKLGAGSVLELDRKVGEAIDIFVNNRLVARGEVVIVDERLGVTMTEIIKDGDSQS
jgi:flagellar motor switch protein FliN/FliY